MHVFTLVFIHVFTHSLIHSRIHVEKVFSTCREHSTRHAGTSVSELVGVLFLPCPASAGGLPMARSRCLLL